MAVSVSEGRKDSASARGRVRILLSDPDADLRAAVVTAVLDWKDRNSINCSAKWNPANHPRGAFGFEKGASSPPEETPGEEK